MTTRLAVRCSTGPNLCMSNLGNHTTMLQALQHNYEFCHIGPKHHPVYLKVAAPPQGNASSTHVRHMQFFTVPLHHEDQRLVPHNVLVATNNPLLADYWHASYVVDASDAHHIAGMLGLALVVVTKACCDTKTKQTRYMICYKPRATPCLRWQGRP